MTKKYKEFKVVKYDNENIIIKAVSETKAYKKACEIYGIGVFRVENRDSDKTDYDDLLEVK
jgi:hypothetical protein